MKIYEKLEIGTGRPYVTKDDMNKAEAAYGHYLEFCRSEHNDNPMTLVEFLLQDVDYDHLDCFMWPKGELVKTKDGTLGMTTGWTTVGCSEIYFKVTVKTTKGVGYYNADDLHKADIPPEVLEYVKATVQNKVHCKVDEPFKEA